MVLLQRIFDSPLVGIVALAILCSTVLPRLPITKWRLPPFLFVWLVPMFVGLGIGYIHPVWLGIKPTLPLAYAPGMLHAMKVVLPYLSVIVPMSVYQIVQDIAAAEGAATVGDNYDARGIVAWDGIGTLVCGLAGSVVCPIVYAILPPYKALGAKISYVFWTGTIFLVVVMSGITMFRHPAFPLVHPGIDDRLHHHWRGSCDVPPRGSEVPQRGTAGNDVAGRRGGHRRRGFGVCPRSGCPPRTPKSRPR